MAELIAGLDGPVYVERVALFDAKRRIQAGRAIEKALRLQVQNAGFSFVEVLAECPTHLGLTPQQAESWVREEMLPVFPLGVKKKDTAPPESWIWDTPRYQVDEMLQLVGAETQPVIRHCAGFPREAFGPEVGLKLAGAGGDGAQTAAMLLTRTAIDEGFDATHIPSYGPESRGGTSYADVRLAESCVLSPAVPRPQLLVAFNAPSLKRFGPLVEPGGVIVYDSAVVSEVPELDRRIRLVPVPCSRIASELGRVMVKNIVALGALQAATGLLPEASLLSAIRRALRDRRALLPLNEEAFAQGVAAAGAAARPAR
jgi:2-oxoisovalerate ferredoxin oxidoreductase beta subunit